MTVHPLPWNGLNLKPLPPPTPPGHHGSDVVSPEKIEILQAVTVNCLQRLVGVLDMGFDMCFCKCPVSLGNEKLFMRKTPVNWTNLYKSIIYVLIRGGCDGGALSWEPVLNRCFWIDHHLSYFRVHLNDLKQRINTIKSRNLPQPMVSEAVKHR